MKTSSPVEYNQYRYFCGGYGIFTRNRKISGQTMAWVWIPRESNNDLNRFSRLTDSNPNTKLFKRFVTVRKKKS